MGKRIYFNNDWKFSEVFGSEMTYKDYDDRGMMSVRIPHTVKEVPFHYFDESMYQMVAVYRKCFVPDDSWRGKRIFLTFEGVAHKCVVYMNGKPIGKHKCGYTAFTVDLTDCIVFDEKNVISVKVDSNESLNIPPFGFVVDYMTFGGIYRDVYIEIKENVHICDVFVGDLISSRKKKDGTRKAVVSSDIKISGLNAQQLENAKIRQSIAKKDTEQYEVIGLDDIDESNVVFGHCNGRDNLELHTEFDAGYIQLWDTDMPNLYQIKTEILVEDKVFDSHIVTHGFRRAVFKKDGFYLNGRKLLIRGLNRHQSYPYVGYAMPESMQKYDADILKLELGVNAVRTSHYPQSQHFINRCDELGIMVFTEIPGWQYVGDKDWKKQAVHNVKDMVLQYRNHPSIILWGVRINESQDDDEFYKKTVAVAKKYDCTRQTGGVRNNAKGSFLEDVYTYNDFMHDGWAPGCAKKESITSDMDKPYLVAEYNGHMFPTKSFDNEEHINEQARRHANVLDAIAGEDNIAGSFGWCMFDYNTHKDFGSGDRICYHGVMDMFRNPKLAAAVYTSQQDEVPFMEIGSSMNIGEHPGCVVGNTTIFTNADSVKVYKNGTFVREISKVETPWKNLNHGPLVVDSKEIGYVGDWGKNCTEFKFEAIKDGRVISTMIKKPSSTQGINMLVSHVHLKEKNSYDVSAVRMEAVDENGNRLPFFNEPIILKASGGVEVIGPSVISLKGGIGGTYVKSNGKSTEGVLLICSEEIGNIKIDFKIDLC